MNYRHEFHAGNFADVFKHIVLTRVLLHLVKKETPFRYIDTHGGSGLYDLSGPQAGRTDEWRMGLGRFAAEEPSWPAGARELVQPYLAMALPALNQGGLYPGSPAIAAALMRAQDRLICCELHPEAAQELALNLGRDRRMKIIEIDGFIGLKAFVPPVERRGIVLIDPAYEQRDDFERSLKVLDQAWRKWATGIYILWYPIKDRRETDAALANLASGKIRRVLRLELQVAAPAALGALASNGLLIVNPPYPLVAEAEVLLPLLAVALARDGDARDAAHHLSWLAGD